MPGALVSRGERVCLRNRRFVDGAYRDTLWYGLARENWDREE